MTTDNEQRTFALSLSDALESEAVHIFRHVAGEFDGDREGPGRRGLGCPPTTWAGSPCARPSHWLDDYADVGRTGAFLLVGPADGATLTAGMADLS